MHFVGGLLYGDAVMPVASGLYPLVDGLLDTLAVFLVHLGHGFLMLFRLLCAFFSHLQEFELVINNSDYAILQVMDLTGRILCTENIYGCHTKSLNLSAGVYVLRLYNGNDVKTQKIVIK